MYNFINIRKDLVPYNFNILLRNVNNQDALYKMEVDYNTSSDFFTFTLLYQDEILIQNEKLTLNMPLFKRLSEDVNLNLDVRYPKDVLIPLSMSNEVERAGYKELGNSVYLFAIDRDVLTNG